MTPLSRLAAAAALLLAGSVAAAEITVSDPYARAASPAAKSGAAFMAITNTGDAPDRLVAASSDIAQRVELHTHVDAGDGIMRMVHVEEGFEIAPGETILLQRGGRHVMFMGLTRAMEQGDSVAVTLSFEKAGDVVLEVPVDLERMPAEGGMDHGAMDHGS